MRSSREAIYQTPSAQLAALRRFGVEAVTMDWDVKTVTALPDRRFTAELADPPYFTSVDVRFSALTPQEEDIAPDAMIEHCEPVKIGGDQR